MVWDLNVKYLYFYSKPFERLGVAITELQFDVFTMRFHISVAAVALIPLSKMIGGSTEDLSLYYGMTIGASTISCL
jgi:hypothetical protein